MGSIFSNEQFPEKDGYLLSPNSKSAHSWVFDIGDSGKDERVMLRAFNIGDVSVEVEMVTGNGGSQIVSALIQGNRKTILDSENTIATIHGVGRYRVTAFDGKTCAPMEPGELMPTVELLKY